MGIRRVGRALGRLIVAGAVVWAATFGAVVAVSAFWPEDGALPGPADAIICLGAGVSRADPSLPDPASDRRARHCATLHAGGVAPVVIFTGYGTSGFPAAEAMAARAIAEGLPPDAAWIEPTALSTIQNAAFSLPMLPEGTRRVILVSDAFHLPRASVIFRLAGADDVALHATPATDRPPWRWMLRESVAIWFNVARGTAYVLGGWLGIDRDTRIGWFN